VDRYARTIVRVAASGNIGAIAEPMSVATAIHGPGAGLDASEAMETLLVGFASEMQRIPQPAGLGEIILVENHRDIFERLQERLRYLASKDIVRFDGGRCFINPGSDQYFASSEVERVNRLALKHLFIAMPFAKEFNNAYYFGIKQPVEQRGRKCERVDQDAFTGDIVERVKRRVSSCELVIADITGNNPNVFYELGYADGMGKPVILISQEQETPFDLKTRRQIRYKLEDILSLAEALGAQLDGLLNPLSGQ
jgi:nucleoside 2-deoxyribosyltransferase